ARARRLEAQNELQRVLHAGPADGRSISREMPQLRQQLEALTVSHGQPEPDGPDRFLRCSAIWPGDAAHRYGDLSAGDSQGTCGHFPHHGLADRSVLLQRCSATPRSRTFAAFEYTT